jgi:hypothetical protein
MRKVHIRPGTNQKVYSQDALDLEATVHRADFDLTAWKENSANIAFERLSEVRQEKTNQDSIHQPPRRDVLGSAAKA